MQQNTNIHEVIYLSHRIASKLFKKNLTSDEWIYFLYIASYAGIRLGYKFDWKPPRGPDCHQARIDIAIASRTPYFSIQLAKRSKEVIRRICYAVGLLSNEELILKLKTIASVIFIMKSHKNPLTIRKVLIQSLGYNINEVNVKRAIIIASDIKKLRK
jgi:hypothetical protein